MRALGLTDAIFFNLGDRYITSTVVLDGPCDLPLFTAEMDAAARDYAPLRDRFRRIWPWFFAHPDPEFDIADHIVVLNAPGVTTLAQLEPVVEKIRRTRPPRRRSPWRVFVVNPAPVDGARQHGDADDADKPVSAIIFHLDHALADGIRCMQVIASLAGRGPDRDPAKARQLQRMSLDELAGLPEHGNVFDAGVSFVPLARRDLRRDTGATEVFVNAAARLLEDADLYTHARPLNHCIAQTQFVRRRAGEGQLGNYLQTVANAVDTGATEKPVRWRIPGLQKIQALPIVQYMIALFPPPLANHMMRTWYSRFDAVVTVLPGPASMQMGGRECLGVYGTPPLSGHIALVILSISLGRNHSIALIPGMAMTGRRDDMLREFTAALTQAPDAQPAPRTQAASAA